MIATSAALGTMFGKYRLIHRLGRGGMADVYLAEDAAEQRQVAIRIIELREDADSREMLEAERLGARLQERFCAIDPHVPRVYAHGELDGCFYVAMELVDGEDLAQMLARGPLRPEMAAEVASQICQCLTNAHTFEVEVDGDTTAIVHGDITPKNIRVNATGEVKLLDFGIAKALSLTRKLTRNAYGSTPYLSPERLDTYNVDVHADLWSLGVVLYEMLSGLRPYRAENTRKLEKLILSKQPPPPLADTCPEALRRVVSKMLDPDLSRRYQTAPEFLADLTAWKEGRQTVAEREWIADVTADEVTRRTRPPVDSPTDEQTRRTSAPDESAAPSTAASSAAVQQPPRKSRLRRVLRTGFWIVALWMSLNELRIWRRADDLARSVVAADATELNSAYEQYLQLANASTFRVGLGALRARLKAQYVAQADRVIADFRRELPAVGKPQWTDAQTWLIRALTLDPTDRVLQASLRYCEGHILRVNGEERLRRRARQAANDSLRQAVQRFEEAATLNTRWADPYVGLLRVYVADMEDLDAALEALRQAERRGYKSGKREAAQFGDAYRARGDRLRRDAITVRGLPQQKQYLEEAATNYQRALDHYADAPGFADVAENVRLTQSRLAGVKAEIDEMDDAGGESKTASQISGDLPWR